MEEGWIGVDLDGTLAHYDVWEGPEHIGPPIQIMVDRVKSWITEGTRVKIFTARCAFAGNEGPIRKWLKDNGLPDLEITNIKDQYMFELWDDRCVQVIINTGERVGDEEVVHNPIF